MTLTTVIARLLIASGMLGLANSALENLSCPEKYGRFAVPSQCDAYIECKDGIPEQMLCPDGLLFNPNIRYNYPCGYPIDVDCGERSNRQRPEPTDECPHQYGYFKLGDEQNCGKFITCVEGRAHIFHCPEGLAYNSEFYRCDWPDQVPDCDTEAFLGFQCPDYLDHGHQDEFTFHPSPYDCQRYYICINGRPRLQICSAGKLFNKLKNICDAAENVTDCEPLASSSEKKKRVVP
ncbi:hypothetical protein K0M31_008253 [Melipona bicolor]|uniref:Chitin-binding type-2 domain-containing protein n=1 Tax=Melipona bicolor TaxID=60889 RepID=A0AA40KK96_9HYME|nr:hypothetical protein K0M31_008253 [Melipona bicolor]